MADYYITATDKETVGTHTYITRVLLHPTNPETIFKGAVKSKDEVIALLKGGNRVFTATWNYGSASWTRQESVSYETRQGREYLRSTPDRSLRDNLLHLLPLANLGL